MTIVLKNQVEASERSLQELEARFEFGHKDQPGEALGLEVRSLLKALGSLARDMFEDAESGRDLLLDADVAMDVARENYQRFVRLDGLFARCARLLPKAADSLQGDIQGRDQFFMAWRKVQDITAFDFDRVLLADKQLESGQGRDLGEVMNELRHRA